MSKDFVEWRDYIESRYGPMTIVRNGFVHAAAVPVTGGISIGIGGTMADAVLELGRSLQSHGTPSTQVVDFEHSSKCIKGGD